VKRASVALTIVCGLLAASTALTQEGRRDSSKARSSQDRASPLPWLVLEALTATRDRPLFAHNRRPLPPPAPPPPSPPRVVAPQQPAKPSPVFALKGIIAERSSTLVLLQDVNTSESIVLRSGDTIGSWRLLVETEYSVSLTGNGEKILLEMFEEENGESK
jgi:hypothetical protein